jgi:hypothetical protein
MTRTRKAVSCRLLRCTATATRPRLCAASNPASTSALSTIPVRPPTFSSAPTERAPSTPAVKNPVNHAVRKTMSRGRNRRYG